MTIEPLEIKQLHARIFRQYGRVTIRVGDVLTRASDFSTDTAYKDAEVGARRACRKNGKALGPWLFIFNNYSYREEG